MNLSREEERRKSVYAALEEEGIEWLSRRAEKEETRNGSLEMLRSHHLVGERKTQGLSRERKGRGGAGWIRSFLEKEGCQWTVLILERAVDAQ